MGFSSAMGSLANVTGVKKIADAIIPQAPKAPKLAAVTPPPAMQMARPVNASAIQNSMRGTGQAGGSTGVAQTFLTGAGGVDPNTLTLGKTLLLGN